MESFYEHYIFWQNLAYCIKFARKGCWYDSLMKIEETSVWENKKTSWHKMYRIIPTSGKKSAVCTLVCVWTQAKAQRTKVQHCSKSAQLLYMSGHVVYHLQENTNVTNVTQSNLFASCMQHSTIMSLLLLSKSEFKYVAMLVAPFQNVFCFVIIVKYSAARKNHHIKHCDIFISSV